MNYFRNSLAPCPALTTLNRRECASDPGGALLLLNQAFILFVEGVRDMAGMIRFLVAPALLVITTRASFGETVQPRDAVGAVETGYERFIDSCAFCHGVDAKGSGPAAGMLEKEPADLTQLARNNGGRLPISYVYDTVDGRNILKPHGPQEMPVWGELWRNSVPDQYAEFYIRARILEIILFLDSIQE